MVSLTMYYYYYYYYYYLLYDYAYIQHLLDTTTNPPPTRSV